MSIEGRIWRHDTLMLRRPGSLELTIKFVPRTCFQCGAFIKRTRRGEAHCPRCGIIIGPRQQSHQSPKGTYDRLRRAKAGRVIFRAVIEP